MPASLVRYDEVARHNRVAAHKAKASKVLVWSLISQTKQDATRTARTSDLKCMACAINQLNSDDMVTLHSIDKEEMKAAVEQIKNPMPEPTVISESLPPNVTIVVDPPGSDSMTHDQLKRRRKALAEAAIGSSENRSLSSPTTEPGQSENRSSSSARVAGSASTSENRSSSYTDHLPPPFVIAFNCFQLLNVHIAESRERGEFEEDTSTRVYHGLPAHVLFAMATVDG